MCGRFSLISPFALLAEEFSIVEASCDLRPDANYSPGQKIAAVIAQPPTQAQDSKMRGNRLVAFQWGLIPSWSKDPSIGRKMFNARAETVAEKPSFRNAFRKSRCLILADGFYEFSSESTPQSRGKKTPYFIRLKSGRPFGMAGLYEKWIPPSGEAVATCTIITTNANEVVAPIHDRMPVIIPKEMEARWLNPAETRKEELLSLLVHYNGALMEVLPASHPLMS